MKITASNLTDVFKSPKASVQTMELKGYQLIEEFFVDNSGLGSPSEPALTALQFQEKLSLLIEEHGSFYTSITNQGQFQVYLGVFKKTGNKNARKIANNTLEIIREGQRVIRFHDTDILIFDETSNTVELFNGGFFTATTKDRLNQFAGGSFLIYQRDFKWYVKVLSTLQSFPFVEGMVLPC